jgi:hypothetical protein
MYLGVAGNVGVSYSFKFPLQISADFRPVIGPYFGKNISGFYSSGLFDGAISVRWKF